MLRHDLTDCTSNGIVIGADGIRLDLNGHQISGNGTLVQGCPDGTACDVGIDNSAGHKGLRVQNGSVTGFGLGVLVRGAERTRIDHVATSENAFLGIVVIESTRSVVEHNRVLRNGIGNDGGGLALVGSGHARVERNTVAGNGSQGIQVVAGSDHNLVARNRVFGNLHAGIGVEGDRNRITRNTVSRNGDNVIIAGNHNVTSRNRISDAVGCPEGCGFGISMERGSGNRFTRNLVTRARNGIRVDAFEGTTARTLIERNVVRDASVDGIVVDLEHAGPVSATVLRRNLVTGSGDDGIDVESTSTTLTRNTARRNGDLGIEAVPGTVDGGRNAASGNGDTRQCTGIVCVR